MPSQLQYTSTSNKALIVEVRVEINAANVDEASTAGEKTVSNAYSCFS